ncbi:MAG: membrane protein insertase YidC, partial [Acidobacteria bacterium]|nr:membrane protein insertase YidC [Acidobacteriota bacterium]
MDQKRLVLAFLLSAVILFGWTFLVERNKPQPNGNANTGANANQPANASPSPSQSVAPVATPQTSQQDAQASSTDKVPRRTITVTTPLYEVQLDARGAVATSWVLTKNKRTGQSLYSVAGGKSSHPPLELIPSEKYGLQSAPENVRQEAGSTALRLITGDAAFDNLLASRNYKVTGVEGDAGDARIEIKPGETKTVSLTLHDDATNSDAVKNLIFNGDVYAVGLEVKLARAGQPITAAKLGVGPSIGDQGIPKFSFYSIAPQSVAVVNGKSQIFYGNKIHGDKNSPDRQIVNGTIDWSGVGDTYFAMAAVPARPSDELELRTTKYDHDANGTKEERYLITSFLKIPTDGSTTQIYVGPKDHTLLAEASETVNKNLQARAVDLEGLINYG